MQGCFGEAVTPYGIVGYHLVWATKRRRRALRHEEERIHCEAVSAPEKVLLGRGGMEPELLCAYGRGRSDCGDSQEVHRNA
jgi:hypothetical protein